MNDQELRRYILTLEKAYDKKMAKAMRWRNIAQELKAQLTEGDKVQNEGIRYRMEVAICEYVGLEAEADEIRKKIEISEERLATLKQINQAVDAQILKNYQNLAHAICEQAVFDYKRVAEKPKRHIWKDSNNRSVIETPSMLRNFINSEQFYFYSGLDGQYILEQIEKFLNVSLSE